MKPDILTEAHGIIYGDRERTYGNPARNLQAIAELWMVFIAQKHGVGLSLFAEDVAMMMVLMKVARLMNDPRHRDSLCDIAGYAGLVDKIDRFEKELQNTPLFGAHSMRASVPTGVDDDDDPRIANPEVAVD